MTDYDTSFDGPPFDDEDDAAPSIEELRDDAPLTTDSANAEAVVREHGRGYLFVLAWSAWLAWDGRRWSSEGARGKLAEAIKITMRLEWSRARARLLEAEELMRIAGLAGQKDEKAERIAKREKGLLRWYEQSQNQAKIEACTKRLEAMLPVSHESLDRAPWLLNVANGTIDMRTADLRAHAREDLLTQLTEIEYHDDASCPTWDEFIRSAMGGNLELALYLQRFVGYAATGHVSEHALLFCYGVGRNGKSTFMAMVHRILGEYACAAPRELLFASKNERHPEEIARLHGKRLAVCAEVPQEAKLDEAKVKDLTGGDVVSCRRMRENSWDLHPTHSFFLSGNHKPNIAGTDDGIWRRLRLVPWLVQVAEGDVDRELPAKLWAEREGILRWIVQGCLEWQRIGLCDPEIVKGATREYREESDAIGRYLAERVVFSAEERIARAPLRKDYETWCEEQGYQPLGARRFAQRLRDSGVTEVSVRVGMGVANGWRGCRLRASTEFTTN